MMVDNELIRQAEMKATGENIHGVNEAICNYKACVQASNGNAWWVNPEEDNPSTRDSFERIAVDWQRYIKNFVSSGKMDRRYRPQVFF